MECWNGWNKSVKAKKEEVLEQRKNEENEFKGLLFLFHMGDKYMLIMWVGHGWVMCGGERKIFSMRSLRFPDV